MPNLERFVTDIDHTGPLTIEWMVRWALRQGRTAHRQGAGRLSQPRRPIDVIAANRPVLILDEPQKTEGGKTLDPLVSLKPLMVLCASNGLFRRYLDFMELRTTFLAVGCQRQQSA